MRMRLGAGLILAVAVIAMRPAGGVLADSPYACDPGAGDYLPCENGWQFTFTGGDLVYDPPEEFCDYFPCVADFGQLDGYLVQCRDLLFSRSGGLALACAGHGGPSRALRVPARVPASVSVPR